MKPKKRIRILDSDELTAMADGLATGKGDLRTALTAVLYSMALSAKKELGKAPSDKETKGNG